MKKIKLERAETIELQLPDGEIYYLKDAPSPHYGFQIFRENEGFYFKTKGALHNSKNYTQFLFIDSDSFD